MRTGTLPDSAATLSSTICTPCASVRSAASRRRWLNGSRMGWIAARQKPGPGLGAAPGPGGGRKAEVGGLESARHFPEISRAAGPLRDHAPVGRAEVVAALG